MTNIDPRIDVIGTAVGDRSRAMIITALMDGRAYTAKELAYRARISAQTASFHLKRLVEWGILERLQQGRHRYYYLANEEIASVIESMMSIAPSEHLRRQPKRKKRMESVRSPHRAGPRETAGGPGTKRAHPFARPLGNGGRARPIRPRYAAPAVGRSRHFFRLARHGLFRKVWV